MKADELTKHESEPVIRRYEIDVCDQCLNLEGDMCSNPGCVFIRCTMAEVRAQLDCLLIAPVIDGERHILQQGRVIPTVNLMDALRRALPETQHWSVSVERNHANLVTIESNCLSGQSEFSDADQRVIHDAADHFKAFIGPQTLTQPTKHWGLTAAEVAEELQDMVNDPKISHVHSGVFLAAIAHLKPIRTHPYSGDDIADFQVPPR